MTSARASAPRWTLLLVLAALSGCSRNAANAESTLPTADRSTDDRGGSHAADARDDQGRGCSLEPIHFGYDSSDLDNSARDVLAGNARCLGQRTPAHVTVTGMADPRGTEEYNLALGDRRARSTVRYLAALGVSEGVRPHSVGEEMATGTDEGSWARDRRAELQAP